MIVAHKSMSSLTFSLDSKVSSTPPPNPQVTQDMAFETTLGEVKRMTPAEDGFLALGTIKIRKDCNGDDSNKPNLFMQDLHGSETTFPNTTLTVAERKGWLRMDHLYDGETPGAPRARVHVLPVDADHEQRGSPQTFKKALRAILPYIDCTIDAWIGKSAYDDPAQTYASLRREEEESLFYIFNTLKSPAPDLSTIGGTVYGYQAVSDVIEDCIMGLKSQLYPYQRRSVAAMVQRETDPAKTPDSRLSRFEDIYGRSFYLDYHDGVLLKKDLPCYTEPQGGILAETMGYGKTLICLALILATRGHYPRPPQDRIDELPYGKRDKVGSLLAMAAKRTKHEGVPWKNTFCSRAYHINAVLDELSKYERAYAEPIFTPTTPDRKGKRPSHNIVHLCSATLIIVPPNLLLQWQQEIEKHVEKNALDVLVLDSPTKAVPNWRQLLKYDVVLITKSRFEKEYRDDDLNQGKSKKGDARYKSPLTELKWLRVICDEGHGFAGSSSQTNAMAMLDKMYIERRWVVSGTPSSTLHGVEVGLSTTSSAVITTSKAASESSDVASGRRLSIGRTLQKHKTTSAHDQEAKDLERLRLIVVNFLHLQPWANQRGSDNANWKRYLAPFWTSNGKRITPPSLRNVLQTLIIRHRIEDIDTDLTLPALHTKTVYLTPSYHDKLAINMFMLVLAANFVTSEREDEDYMFHPRNRHKFDQLINNLRQATLHWVGFTEQDLQSTIKTSNEYLDKNYDKVSDADGLLLTEAIMMGEHALNDPTWVSFSRFHEMGVYMQQFPEHASEAWALDGQVKNPILLGTVQAREVQRFFKDRILKGVVDPLSGLAGAGVKTMKALREKAEEEATERTKARQTQSDKQQIGTIDEPKLRAPSAPSSRAPRSLLVSTKLGPERPLSETIKVTKSSVPRKRGHADALDDLSTSLTKQHLSVGLKTVQNNVRMPPTYILGFTSSKLAYLMSQILIHSATSKSIIFYSGNNSAFWIAEALELLRVPHRIYASTLSVAQRNAYLSLFNSDDSIRVLLMDLKQASHGLHIACANRVYIVAPIWDKGVESQAIKRAHRIGQTKDVFVETLVLKGTFEEEIVKRRMDIESEDVEGIDRDQSTLVCDRSDVHGCHNLDGQKMDEASADDSVHQDLTLKDSHSPVESSTFERLPQETLPKQKGQKRHSSKDRKATPQKQKHKSTSLLDDNHMVRVLKDVKFLKLTKDEQADGHEPMARVARMDAHARGEDGTVLSEKTMLFDQDWIYFRKSLSINDVVDPKSKKQRQNFGSAANDALPLEVTVTPTTKDRTRAVAFEF